MPTSSRPTAPSTASDRVLRFARTERLLHWTHAGLFLALVLTGAAILFPFLATAIQSREAVRAIHIAAGFGLVLAPVAIALLGSRRAMQRDLAEIDRWDEDDWLWLRGWKYYRYGRPMPPPQGRFNAGQKLNAIFTGATIVLFLVTGIIMWRWHSFPRWLVENAGGLHDLLALLAVLVWVGHVYMAMANPSTRESLRGITRGWVKREWAHEHYEKWVEETDRQAEPRASSPGQS